MSSRYGPAGWLDRGGASFYQIFPFLKKEGRGSNDPIGGGEWDLVFDQQFGVLWLRELVDAMLQSWQWEQLVDRVFTAMDHASANMVTIADLQSIIEYVRVRAHGGVESHHTDGMDIPLDRTSGSLGKHQALQACWYVQSRAAPTALMIGCKCEEQALCWRARSLAS